MCLSGVMISETVSRGLRAQAVNGMSAEPTQRWAEGQEKWFYNYDVMRRASILSSFSFTLCHPSLHVRDACLHGQDSDMYLIRRTGLK